MAAPAGATQVPLFARWSDTTGAAVDVLLHWHQSLPAALPAADEAICVVRLCAAAPLPECFEARLQRQHMRGSPEDWPPERLRRLMAAMSRPGGPGAERDTVLLRREMGRLIIDVVFAAPEASVPAGPATGRVVEVLNAYPPGTSLHGSVAGLLRSVIATQRAHRRRIAEAEASLGQLRAGLAQLEGRWSGACLEARGRRRDGLRRFALLLQAKIDKETELHAEAEERYWLERNRGRACGEAPGGPPPEAEARPGPRDEPPAAKRRREPPARPERVGARPTEGTRTPAGPAASLGRSGQGPQAAAALGPRAAAALSLLDPTSSGDEAPAPTPAPAPARPPVRAEADGTGGPTSRATPLRGSFAASLFDSDEE